MLTTEEVATGFPPTRQPPRSAWSRTNTAEPVGVVLVRLGRTVAVELIDRTSVRVMPTGTVDLTEVAARLANRASNRAEATVQSDLRLLLLAAGLNLREDHLEEVVLEAPVGKRRRIDVEVGATVFEVKRDLRVGNVRAEAVGQLAGYVRDRVVQVGARYVGVLTDGVEWHLYHLDGDELTPVSSYTLSGPAGLDGLVLWLDGVLATATAITPTPTEVTRRLGAGSPAFALDVADLTALYQRYRGSPGVVMRRTLVQAAIHRAGHRFLGPGQLVHRTHPARAHRRDHRARGRRLRPR